MHMKMHIHMHMNMHVNMHVNTHTHIHMQIRIKFVLDKLHMQIKSSVVLRNGLVSQRMPKEFQASAKFGRNAKVMVHNVHTYLQSHAYQRNKTHIYTYNQIYLYISGYTWI